MSDEVSLSDFPVEIKNFNFTHILNYATSITELSRSRSNLSDRDQECEPTTTSELEVEYSTSIVQGRRLFASKFVTSIKYSKKTCSESEPGFDLRWNANVKAEMRKKGCYDVSCVISATNKVTEAKCECPWGAKPACCKHIFALLSAIEEYSCQELYKAPTERLQKWHQPANYTIKPTRFASTNPPSCLDSISKTVSFSALTGLKQTIPIFSVLNATKNAKKVPIVDDLFYSKTTPLPLKKGQELSLTELSISPKYLNSESLFFYNKHVRHSLEFFQSLEFKTMHQDTDIWHQERNIRVTASKVHDILKSSNFDVQCNAIFAERKRDVSKIPAIMLGKRLEPMVKNILRSDYPEHIFRNTGLVVNPDIPFIGASPDGLLFHKEDTMLVEIKCIFNPCNNSLQDLCQQRKNFCLIPTSEGKYQLKRNHKYFFQIQLQLFCSKLDKCLFVMFFDFKTPIQVFKEVIHADLNFWNTSRLQLLSQFYFEHYMPRMMKLSQKAC